METACRPADIPVRALYERNQLPALTGGPLRPGGLTLTGELLRFAAPAPGTEALDIGCGPGHSLALMAGTYQLIPHGLDSSSAMLALAALAAPEAILTQGSATALPYPDHRFRLVSCECVLSLTGDMGRALQEMYRVLAPGGRLILTDLYCRNPHQQPLPAEIVSCASHARPLTVITEGLNRAGFSLLTLRDRTDLLRQLAGQIIFTHGSLEAFWRLFMAEEAARRTSCALAAARLGYYALVAEKGVEHE